MKELYEELMKNREMATVVMEDVPHKLRAGMEGHVRAAQSKSKELEERYRNTVAQKSVIISITGKYGEEFAKIAKEKFKTLSIDFLKVIDDIGDSIIKRGGQDIYTSKEHLMTMDELNKIKMKYQILQLPVFQAKFDGVGPNTSIKQGLLTQFTEQYGGSLYSAITYGEIGFEALDVGFKGNRLPVVVYNCITDIDSTILPKPAVTLKIQKKPTIESVKDTLINVRDQINSNKTTQE